MRPDNKTDALLRQLIIKIRSEEERQRVGKEGQAAILARLQAALDRAGENIYSIRIIGSGDIRITLGSEKAKKKVRKEIN